MAEPTSSNDFSIFDLPAGENPFTAKEPDVPAAVVKEAVVAPVVVEPAPVKKEEPLPPVKDTQTPLVKEDAPVKKEEPPVKEEPVVPAAKVGKQIDLSDDDLVPITQDGKVVYVRWGDQKGHEMRVADYTRKTTRVAQREREVEEIASTLQERQDRLLEIVSDPEQLAALYTKITKGKTIAASVADKPVTPAPAEDPDALVTRGDLTRHAEELIQKAREERAAEQATADENAKTARLQAIAAEVTDITEKTLDLLLEEHKAILGDFPHVDVVIKKMAGEMKPKNAEEVKQALIDAAANLARQLGRKSVDQKKREVLAKGTLAPAEGLEPSGGVPAPREPRVFNSWDDVDAAVIAHINAKG